MNFDDPSPPLTNRVANLAKVKRSIASRRHATLLSRVRRPGLPDCTVPELLTTTDYTSAQVWKDARRKVLDVDVSFDGEHWTPVITYLDNVRQQSAEVKVIVQWHDGTTEDHCWQANEHPLLTLQDICIWFETTHGHALQPASDTRSTSTWSFMVHDSRNHTLLNTTALLTEPEFNPWWSTTRFDPTQHDYRELLHLRITPLNLDTFEPALLEAMDLNGNREPYQALLDQQQQQIQWQRDAALRQEQDTAYAAALVADRAVQASSTLPTLPTLPTSSVHTTLGTSAEPMDLTGEEGDNVEDVKDVEDVQESEEGNNAEETEETEDIPLTRDQVRAARQQYFASRFGQTNTA